ncbi:MAG: hypothetical protein IPN42_01615 [Methylococcaceae bacterium]|nr:hypothetical protein [Methylococcaceae bacterium]
MTLKLALMLVIFAFAGLLTATVVNELEIVGLAEQLSQFSAIVLLSGFSLICLLGLGLLAKLIVNALTAYFSAHRRFERRLLFYLHSRYRLERLYQLRTKRVLYFNRLQRKRLLRQNDKKSTVL